MSSANKALRSNGPSVGRFKTTDTMIVHDIRKGKRYPSVLINGFKARRTGYFNITFHSASPLALAVITYGLFSSSSKLARITRIKAAVPAVPTTNTAIHK